MNAIGHPIMGDNLYDGPAAGRLMLHACSLTLPHPQHNTPLVFECPAAF
jgi:tRNA pseudouridine32 synthase/23S rRNA pseudouridine746 synthase